MRCVNTAAGAAIGLVLFTALAGAQEVDLRAVFAAPIPMERSADITAVPIETRMGKLFVEATINGRKREFMFDTGSPTILTREFADTLDLAIIGQNTGMDANGNPVTMDIARVESLTLGQTTFRDVPVFIHDYASLDTGACFLDGGFIGSELFAGSAWRIDLESGRLSIAETAASLNGSAPDLEARLYDFGYPHAPILDYAVGEFADKALFDTGNSEEVTLFGEVANVPSVQDHIVAGSARTGRGSRGESAGGRGAATELVRFTLSDFGIGGESFGPVRAATRSVPPTLIGAGILGTHIVTLDYPGGRFLLEARREPEPRRPDAGYAVAYIGDEARVVQLYEGSSASRAGLRLGDHVTHIDDRPLAVTPDAPKCPSARWLVESFDPTRATRIVVERGSAVETILIPSVVPD